jgi:hypothetical protein
MKWRCVIAILLVMLGRGSAESSNEMPSSLQVGRAGETRPSGPDTGESHAPAPVLFQAGTLAFNSEQYGAAVTAFRAAGRVEPASGTLLNLGLAAWQQGQPGAAVWAWEQSAWIDSFNHAAPQNLRFARKAAQLEAPELTWYEMVSTWLPVNWWAWIAAGSLWIAIGATFLPGFFRVRRRAGFQALAAASLTIFLLSVPALFGVQARSHIGIILQKDCPLRLTPTVEAQTVTRLAAGEALRVQRTRGDFYLVKNSRLSGWVQRSEFGLITQRL